MTILLLAKVMLLQSSHIMHASLSSIKRATALTTYYTARVFEEAGWIGRQAILMTGINSVIYVLSTIPTCAFSSTISTISYLKTLPDGISSTVGVVELSCFQAQWW